MDIANCFMDLPIVFESSDAKEAQHLLVIIIHFNLGIDINS